jgi:hypothetical protein
MTGLSDAAIQVWIALLLLAMSGLVVGALTFEKLKLLPVWRRYQPALTIIPIK